MTFFYLNLLKIYGKGLKWGLGVFSSFRPSILAKSSNRVLGLMSLAWECTHSDGNGFSGNDGDIDNDSWNHLFMHGGGTLTCLTSSLRSMRRLGFYWTKKTMGLGQNDNDERSKSALFFSFLRFPFLFLSQLFVCECASGMCVCEWLSA